MWDCIEFLKGPNLVLKIQRFYGIRKNESPAEFMHKNKSVCKHYKETKCKDCFHLSELSRKSDELVNNRNGVVLRSNKICDGKGNETDAVSSESDSETKDFVITNWFWYYLFIFGTELGDEIFYATFIPFWFWNIDGAVGRRVVMVWTIIMYVGQGIKDVVCWPRPSSPPVHRLQKKWSDEYGMPSTHAMVGVSIPFSVVLYTINRYQYPLFVGLFIATIWCTVMCLSRLYLGMHSVLDIVVGLVLAVLLMVPLIPLIDSLDRLILISKWSPFILFILSISALVFYPKGKGDWTPTRGDTTLVISVCVGVLIGAWTNYQLGEMVEPTTSPPYNIIWPSYNMLGLSALRTVIGMCCIIGARAVCKSMSYAALCYLASLSKATSNAKQNNDRTNADINDSHDKINLIIDLCRKYFTYIVLGFMTVYLLPNVFRMLRIERPTFYTEI